MRLFSILLPVLLLLFLSSTAQALPGFGAGVRGTYWLKGKICLMRPGGTVE